MSNIHTFQFETTAIRAIEAENSSFWFIAADIAAVLGYRDAEKMVRMLDDDEKGTHNAGTLGGDQTLTIVSESGLYACILKSRRPEARAFRKWVTAEVLPSIRKHGGYISDTATPEQVEALRRQLDEQERLIEEQQRLLADTHDSLTRSEIDRKALRAAIQEYPPTAKAVAGVQKELRQVQQGAFMTDARALMYKAAFNRLRNAVLSHTSRFRGACDDGGGPLHRAYKQFEEEMRRMADFAEWKVEATIEDIDKGVLKNALDLSEIWTYQPRSRRQMRPCKEVPSLMQ